MESKTKFKIRFAKVEEMKRVQELVKELHDYQKMKFVFRFPTEEDLLNELTHKDIESDKQIVNRFGTFTVVAVDLERKLDYGEYILGYIIYSYGYSTIEGRNFYVTSFYLQEEYRRHGLGTKLMEFMRVHATAMGYKNVDIPVMNNNDKGLKFYSRFNYQDVNSEFFLMGQKLRDPKRNSTDC